MIRQVDRIGDLIIQKIITRKGKFLHYQVVKPGENDASKVRPYATLQAAREAVGKEQKVPQ